MMPSTMIILHRTSSSSRLRRLEAMGLKIMCARIQPYRVVISAVPISEPMLLEPLSRFMPFSMLIRPTRVPTIPKAGATAEAFSYMLATSSWRPLIHSISFMRIERTLSPSLASTTSKIACLKNGSVCLFACSSSARRPFLRAT